MSLAVYPFLMSQLQYKLFILYLCKQMAMHREPICIPLYVNVFTFSNVRVVKMNQAQQFDFLGFIQIVPSGCRMIAD